MSRDEIQKLLGGYATGTLSEAERSALFEAALEDQDLFDALAKEQALRDVLDDSSARQQLIQALGPARERSPWWRRPAVLATAGSMALLIVAGFVVVQTRKPPRPETLTADVIVPPSAAPVKAIELPAPRTVAKAAPAAPPPARELAVGALSDTAEAASQLVRAAPALAPMPSMRAAKMMSSLAAKPAVEYTLLLRAAGGAYVPVPPGAVFHAGDSVRLQIEPREAGYLYLLQRDATGGWNLVASQHAEQSHPCVLPSTGGLESDTPAKLELRLVLSRVETADAGALASNAPVASTITIEYR